MSFTLDYYKEESSFIVKLFDFKNLKSYESIVNINDLTISEEDFVSILKIKNAKLKFKNDELLVLFQDFKSDISKCEVLSFKNVEFSYIDHSTTLFKNIDYRLDAKEKTLDIVNYGVNYLKLKELTVFSDSEILRNSFPNLEKLTIYRKNKFNIKQYFFGDEMSYFLNFLQIKSLIFVDWKRNKICIYRIIKLLKNLKYLCFENCSKIKNLQKIRSYCSDREIFFKII